MEREKKSFAVSAEVLQVIFVTIAVTFSWLLFAGEYNLQEGVVAVIAGFATATGGYALRSQTGHHQSGLKRWLRNLPGIIGKALKDCWRLTVVLYQTLSGKPSRGTFKRIPFEYGTNNPDDTGRRILVTIGTTLQPNSYVAGFNREKKEVLVHQLDPTPDTPIKEDLRRSK